MTPTVKSAQEALSELSRRTPEPPINWLMSMTLTHPNLVSLAAGFTDQQTLPLKESRQLLQTLLAQPKAGRAALQYGSTPGDPRLRQLTGAHLHQTELAALGSTHLAEARDPGDTSDRLLITSGSQQLLYMISECLCDPGDIVLVEDPTYFVYLGITASHGLRCHGIAMEPDGINLRSLEERLEKLRSNGELGRLKLLYLVTYFQNPTGITTHWEKKRRALELLRRYEKHAGHRLYLVEDAAYRELRFAGPDVPSALTLPEAAGRVIYAGTFSKPFASGARVGFGVLPPHLLQVVLRIKGNHDFGTSNLLQQLLRCALDSGAYTSHVAQLRQRYASKAASMVRALRRHWRDGVNWVEPRGGLYVWASLPKSLKSGPNSAFFKRALQHEVLYVPGVFCYAADPDRRRPDHEMRLSFGGARVADIDRGITRLAATFREIADKPRR